MKCLIKKKIFVVMSILAALFTTACVDETSTVDFDTAFDNLALGGEVPIPVIKEVKSTIGDALGKIESLPDELKIGFIKHDEFEDSVLTAVYTHPEPIYKPLEKINDDFLSFRDNMEILQIKDLQFGVDNYSVFNLDFDMKDAMVGGSQDLRKIDHIDFTDAKVYVKLTDTNITPVTNAFLKVEFEIPTPSGQSNLKYEVNFSDWKNAGIYYLGNNEKQTFTLQVLQPDYINYNTIKATVTAFNDGTVVDASKYIKFEVGFETGEGDFVVWGWFNHVLASGVFEAEEEILPADIQSYLSDGTVLKFHDPRLYCDVISNVGVPLVFTMMELGYREKDQLYQTAIKKDYSYDIAGSTYDASRGEVPEISEEASFKIHKKTGEPFINGDEAKFLGIFNTNLDSLYLYYKVTTKKIENIAQITPTGEKMQHISKKSNITIHPKAELPMILGAGSVIIYSDTIEANLSEEELDFNFEDIPESAKATLYLGYQNTLPLGLGAKAKLLKEDKETEIKAFSVNGVANGEIVFESDPIENPTWKEIKLEFSNAQELHEGRFLVIETYSDRKVPTTKTVAFTKSQGLKVKLSADVNANFTVDDIENLTK